MKIFGIDSGKLSKWLVIVFAGASVVCIAALLISGLPGAIRNGEDWPTMKLTPGKDLSFDASQEFSSEGIDQVRIDLSFESAEIFTAAGDAFEVRYQGSARNADDWSDIFTMEVKEKTLVLDSHWGNAASVGGNVNLEVGIPSSFDGILEFDGASGSLNARDFSVSVLDARLVSGRIKVEGIQADSVSLKVSSGTLDVEDLSAETVNLRAVSGGIDVSNLAAGTITGKSGSGRSSFRDISGSLVFSCVSGAVIASFVNPGDEIDIDVSSGRIDLTLPSGTGFDLDARTSSGTIKSDFPIAVSGSMSRNSLKGRAGNGDGRVVKLHSTSGGIDLNQG